VNKKDHAGFYAHSIDEMWRGVVGVGHSNTAGGETDHVGVEGYTLAAGQRESLGSGTGVLGRSAGGKGVEGTSETGIGVHGKGNIGVQGEGGIGVQGDGVPIGLDGGPPGPVQQNVFMGVRGRARPTEDLYDFSYGGWFSRGPEGALPGVTGTAPLHIEPAQATTPPLAAQAGDVFVDNSGRLWFCAKTGDNNPTQADWWLVQLVKPAPA
jgi:hypothetical protein